MAIDIDIIMYNIIATGNNYRECGSTGLEFSHRKYFDVIIHHLYIKMFSVWVRIFEISLDVKI